MWCTTQPPADKSLPRWHTTPSDKAQQPPQIIVVEDNLADIYLIRHAVAHHHINAAVHYIMHGDEAFRLVEEFDFTGQCPALIVLDLNLPGRSGTDILRRLRHAKQCGATPVIIVTSSDAPADRRIAKELGANHYFHKPAHLDDFLAVGLLIKQFLPAN